MSHSAMQIKLNELEQELKAQNLWQAESPSAEALASREPFAIDTLSLPQWLQFVFIPRMRALIRAEAPLPQGFSIAPYAEEFYRSELLQRTALLTLLRQIDEL